jgi:dipeptidase D
MKKLYVFLAFVLGTLCTSAQSNTNAQVINGLQPQLLWTYFAKISAIPRCSREEGPIANYISDEAADRHFAFKKDAANNVLVLVPATPGR